MKLKEIHRTSTFAWSPSLSIPLLATGTVAGALDESFSNDSQLEIWGPDFLDKNEYALGGDAGQPGPKASVTTTSRFNRLAWGYVDSARPRGVLAAGMENGELGIWDPAKILNGADASDSLVLRNTIHTGPVRGLDFNPLQTNLLSSGATNGEIYIWDLKDPSKPYSPGTRSTKLDETTAIAWNNHVPHILATSSSSGYTVVWDLRGKREMVALAYSGGAGTTGGSVHGGGAMAIGGRRGMSDVSWHPDNATRLVTASEDDTSPIIMSWDLRNARAPEKILTGHEKGVLSLSWCKQDADLLLSCGKDNRVLCWNPQTSEIIGELPPANNWAFQVQWCPRNPDLLATAFFDGTIGVHSIQSTNETAAPAPVPQQDGADLFDAPGFGQTSQSNLSLKQPPKWLRRPVSSSFGYGGRLVTVNNLPNAQGRNQSSVVHLRTVITEHTVIERANKHQDAVDEGSLSEFAERRSTETQGKDQGNESWKALLSLFKANSREELITLFGFSKTGIVAEVAETIKNVKATAVSSTGQEQDDAEGTPHEPVVSFVEPEKDAEPSREGAESPDQPQSAGPMASETTPSEFSMSATSEGTKAADLESTTTEHSLFADDAINGTPQTDAAADFFSSMGTIRGPLPGHVLVPHTNYGQDSSVAATIGSGPSSVASEVLKSNTFAIYPKETSEMDRLVTKALVLGDFESAVSLCVASDRFADAILLAVKGGVELLQKTQKAYFERQTTTLPYLRLYQSIVTNDLTDIVQNADLREWQEIFVVLCTFAKQEEFPALAEQLGQRLEFQGNLIKVSAVDDSAEKALEFRKHATLCYLAATKLEKLVNVWVDEMREEEESLQRNTEELPDDASRHTTHAQALQTFIEKVTVFRSATDYVDVDLKQTPEDADAKSYKLAALYDRYFEYTDLLASQGLVTHAVKYLEYTPRITKRLLLAAGTTATPKVSAAQPLASAPIAPAAATSYAQPTYTSNPYGGVQTQGVQQQQAQPQTSYGAYSPQVAPNARPTSVNPYAPPQAAAPLPSQPYQSMAPPPPSYPSSQNTYAPGASSYHPPGSVQQGMVPPPPPPITSGPGGMHPAPPPQAMPPPPKKRENGGWNDAPKVSDRRNTPCQVNLANKPNPLTTPFPNAPAPAPGTPSNPYFHGQQPQALPPPPRAGASTPQRLQGPPPPRGQSLSHQTQPPPPASQGSYAPPHPGQVRPGSGGPGQYPLPPSRLLSPPQGGPPPPPSGAVHFGGQPPPSGMARATPPPQNGPYGPPTHATQAPPQLAGRAPGPYGAQGPPRAGPPGMQGPPPPGASSQRSHGAPGDVAGASRSAPTPPPKAVAPAAKYPRGDRSHIPESSKPAYDVLSEELRRLRQISPPQQKRMVDDTERRLNALFDALNCETLSKPVVEQLVNLTNAMSTRNRDAAMAIHVDLLTRGSMTDDIGLWMAGVKQLIIRL
ncbi:hypothetical protein JB92DRAFT_3141158 [Gautieria morchelliformis]|nr:hypothetical protein JB92DRAFT_3141158 [Gautieria morchelliformis]